jgi:hypothetical protein
MFAKCEKYMNMSGCKFLDAKVGGKLTFPEAGWASDGSLLLIRGTVTSYDYATVRQAFEAKWGKPTFESQSSAQNGYGAKIEIPSSVWRFAEGEMTLVGPSFNGRGRFEFQSIARKAYMESLNRPKADF